MGTSQPAGDSEEDGLKPPPIKKRRINNFDSTTTKPKSNEAKISIAFKFGKAQSLSDIYLVEDF